MKQVDDHLWLVTFMDYDLGYFDDETCRLEPLATPFGPKVLRMSPEYPYPRDRNGRWKLAKRVSTSSVLEICISWEPRLARISHYDDSVPFSTLSSSISV